MIEINNEPMVIPIKVDNTPVKANNGDKAETYSFKNHQAGAGQRSFITSRILNNADKVPVTVARICSAPSMMVMSVR